MYGVIPFYAAAKKACIKPIIGLEAYVAPRGMTDKEGKADADYHHLILLARDDVGHRNLLARTTTAPFRGSSADQRVTHPPRSVGTRVQRRGRARCPTLDVITLEMPVTEPSPISATRNAQADAAYDARFESVRDRLVRICAGFVGADAAEDVVHDAYLRGRARFAQIREMDLFEAWVTRLAINLCVNRHRAGRRLRDLLPSLRPRATAAPRDAGLRELVERLPSRERTLVVLHYGHGYQFDEIARMTGVSTVNARTIVFRARRRLADQLREPDR